MCRPQAPSVHTVNQSVVKQPQQYRLEAFTQDILKLLARYHVRARSVIPQGRMLKLTNHWATSSTLQQAMGRTFLTNTELFGSTLNCFMSGGISYYSAFPEDEFLRRNHRLLSIPLDWLIYSQPGIRDRGYAQSSRPRPRFFGVTRRPFLVVLIQPA